jgi:hypothetical protein
MWAITTERPATDSISCRRGLPGKGPCRGHRQGGRMPLFSLSIEAGKSYSFLGLLYPRGVEQVFRPQPSMSPRKKRYTKPCHLSIWPLLESSNIFKPCNESDCSNRKRRSYSRVLLLNYKPNLTKSFSNTLHQLELDDWGRYGKARDKYEKHLRDPDDVFIHAKERRKQLAKQRKKRR